jgi:catechol 2,3-dioxygenase-like lactoylglutathione lyase family enzyme
MDQRITLITLGVADVARARAFYASLGWKESAASVESTAFFQAGSLGLALWGREALARDLGAEPPPAGAFSGVALAYNARSKALVDAALAEAVAAGGTLRKAARDAEWGGYSGYFADPDGHVWEVAWNPHFGLGPNGELELP